MVLAIGDPWSLAHLSAHFAGSFWTTCLKHEPTEFTFPRSCLSLAGRCSMRRTSGRWTDPRSRCRIPSTATPDRERRRNDRHRPAIGTDGHQPRRRSRRCITESRHQLLFARRSRPLLLSQLQRDPRRILRDRRLPLWSYRMRRPRRLHRGRIVLRQENQRSERRGPRVRRFVPGRRAMSGRLLAALPCRQLVRWRGDLSTHRTDQLRAAARSRGMRAVVRKVDRARSPTIVAPTRQIATRRASLLVNIGL